MVYTRRYAVAVAGTTLLVAVLFSGLFSGTALAQDDQPAWADDLFERMERAAEAYNAGVGPDERGVLEQWLLSDARVNLYVEGPDGSEAAVSFRTDDRLRVTRLQRGRHEHPTLRVRTSKAAMERIADADDPSTAIDREVWAGRVRIKRIYEPLPGVLIAIGVGEVVLGVGGVVLAAAAVAKFGVQGILSVLWGGVQRLFSGLVSAGRTLWESLSGVAALLTVLDQLGLLERMKEGVGGVYERMRTVVVGAGALFRRQGATDTGDDDGQDG